MTSGAAGLSPAGWQRAVPHHPLLALVTRDSRKLESNSNRAISSNPKHLATSSSSQVIGKRNRVSSVITPFVCLRPMEPVGFIEWPGLAVFHFASQPPWRLKPRYWPVLWIRSKD